MDFGSKKTEKLKCLLHYFERIVEFPPSGAITILRHSIEAPKWARIENRLSELYATSDGRIEDEGHGMLQVDFANKYIGVTIDRRAGDNSDNHLSITLSSQEDNESILIVGAERYSNYTGYGDTFRWIERPYVPLTTRDDSGRSLSELVAIDALLYDRSEKLQFSIDCINRELKKAYSGFSVTVQGTREIATGNWGCGAFKGNLQLKSMIQLIAASAVQRPLRYFTFGNKNFAEELNQMVELLHNKNVTIGRLYKLLCEYGFFLSQSRTTLFEFLVQSLQDFVTQ